MALPGLSDVAVTYAATVLDAIRREYPHSLRHVMRDADDRPTPRAAHPAFYGCFDWHSSVEMHWALVRMLRVAPAAVPAAEIAATLDEHLGPDALAAETRYVTGNPGWERPYGWGWLLALAAELADWAELADGAEPANGEGPDARRWAANLEPLAAAVTAGFVQWLPRSVYPDRAGTHGNTAFALSRSLPWARRLAAAGDTALLDAISEAAVRWFAADVEYPASWEPNGNDFLSPALAEAELIAELARPVEAFPRWLDLFLPGLADGLPEALLEPAVVGDPDDGQGAHLYGLNLYRAHAFGLIAGRLARDDPRAEVLAAARDRHAAAALPAVIGGGWMVEHWLACYAVLLLG